MKFYKDSYGKWYIGDHLITSPLKVSVSNNQTYITLEYLETRPGEILYTGPIAGLTDNSNNSYVNYDGLMAACSSFFAKASNSSYGGIVEIDLGSTPKTSGTFNITLSGLTVGDSVIVNQASGVYTNKGTLDDESEFDTIIVKAYIISNTVIKCHWESIGFVRGNYKFNYIIL